MAAHHHYQTDNSGGAFVSGFTLGIFAGAAGYFLFSTEKGAKLRKQLVEEWQNAQAKMYQEGVIASPDISLRDMLKEFVHKIASSDHPLSEMVDEFAASATTSKKSRTRKPAGKRFRGT